MVIFSCYGQEKLTTPNIDRLASEGMRFTAHYSGNTVCTPSRAVLITGQHSGHAHVRGNLGGEKGAELDPKMTVFRKFSKPPVTPPAHSVNGDWGKHIWRETQTLSLTASMNTTAGKANPSRILITRRPSSITAKKSHLSRELIFINRLWNTRELHCVKCKS